MEYNEAEEIAKDMIAEVLVATDEFEDFSNAHEGYAVMKEEVDELWEEIKKGSDSSKFEIMNEAKQVGAMAIRFIYDLNREMDLN